MLFETPDLQLLKEAADRRALNRDVTDAVTGWFEARTTIHVLDLSTGTGASVRSLAPLLPPDQTWRLLVRSEQEEKLARDHLTRWAPAFQATLDGLILERQGLRLVLRFQRLDPVATGGAVPCADCHLAVIGDDVSRYTASAVRGLVAALAAHRVVPYARLLYDGRLKLTPHHAADGAMTAALNRRLMADTGHGAALGPLAANELTEQLKLADYGVIEGASPLHLKASDTALMRAVQSQMAEAQRTIAKGHDKMIDTWLARPRSSLEISQTDLVGLPS